MRWRRRRSAEQRARAFEDASRALRSAVRIFPDYAGTVIWFTEGPVDYAESGVSRELVEAMEAWESDFYRGIDDYQRWVSAAAQRDHAIRGVEIARRFSAEIGDIVDVEVADPRGGELRMQAAGAGTNPAAVAAFRAMIERSETDEREWAARIRSGARMRFRLLSAEPADLPDTAESDETAEPGDARN